MHRYATLAEVPTPALEYQLDLLERMRDRGDFVNMEAYHFYYESGIPFVEDVTGIVDLDAEVLAVLEELMSRDVQR